MSHLLAGLLLALAGSLALNVSYVIQHVASVHAPPINLRRPLWTVRVLSSSRLWLGGGVLGITGWSLSIAALTQAPLSMVQAFAVAGIVLLVPIGVRVLGHRLTRRELAGVALVIVGLLAMTIGRGSVGNHSHFHNAVLGAYLLVSVGVGALLAVSRRGHPHALAAGGGALYGAADVAIKALTGLAADHGVIAALFSPWLIAVAGGSIGGFFCFQRALQSGRAVPVIALMTAACNLVSIIGGLTVFRDPLGHRAGAELIHVIAFALIVLAAWLLAPVQAALVGGDESARPGRSREPAGGDLMLRELSAGSSDPLRQR